MPILRRALMTVALLLGLAAPAHAQREPLAAALLEFESTVTWEAVSPEWRRLRPGWVQQATAAENWRQSAALLLQLEANMGWGAVQESWRGRRPAWVAETQGARTPADVARHLLELEAAPLWSAVNASWRQARPGWVGKVGALAGGGGSATK